MKPAYKFYSRRKLSTKKSLIVTFFALEKNTFIKIIVFLYETFL